MTHPRRGASRGNRNAAAHGWSITKSDSILWFSVGWFELMSRRPKAFKAPPSKERRSITIDPELDAWLQSQVGVNRPYSSYSHAVQVAVATLREQSKPKRT